MEARTWRKELIEALSGNHEVFPDDVEATTLTEEELDEEFSYSCGGKQGDTFVLWTKEYVYFNREDDYGQSVDCISRHPFEWRALWRP